MSFRMRPFEKTWMRTDLPNIRVGDAVEVAVKIVEGDKHRVQMFAGTVIARRGQGLGETFTVRRIVAGEGVERIFPLHSPVLEGIHIVRSGRVRRAKLYYMRDRVGKGTRLREVVRRQPADGTPAKGVSRGAAAAASRTPAEATTAGV